MRNEPITKEEADDIMNDLKELCERLNAEGRKEIYKAIEEWRQDDD